LCSASCSFEKRTSPCRYNAQSSGAPNRAYTTTLRNSILLRFYIDLVLTGLKDAKPLDGRVLISMEMGGVRERREKCLSRVGRTIRHTFAPTRPVGKSGLAWRNLGFLWVQSRIHSSTDNFES
jgi:hypothetical protein